MDQVISISSYEPERECIADANAFESRVEVLRRQAVDTALTEATIALGTAQIAMGLFEDDPREVWWLRGAAADARRVAAILDRLVDQVA
jgi:hypothetical protein